MTPSHTRGYILTLREADSTNSELRRRADSLDNLSAVAAVGQTSGRGQGDHSWYSTPGLNLTFSILFKFGHFPPRDSLLLSCVAALGVHDYLLSKGVVAGIKWPNDIWVDSRKICGLLIENRIDGDSLTRSIVGVGFNLNETSWPEDLPNPVSLKELTGVTYSVDEELVRLYESICRRYEQLGSEDGRMTLQEEFGKFMFRLP